MNNQKLVISMKTSAFNSTQDLKKLLKTTGERCPIHNEPLIRVDMPNAPKAGVCPICAKERVAEKEKEIEYQGGDEVIKAKTYGWLKRYSIITDDSLYDASLDNYETPGEEEKQNKQKAERIAMDYLNGTTGNAIFSGNPGTGKSHLAMSVLKKVNAESNPSRRCLFISVDEMMRLVKSSFDSHDRTYSEEAIVKKLCQADLLVMDDLGAEVGAINTRSTASDWTTKMLYAVVNGRMKKPTIWTTNLSSKQLQQIYDRKLVSRMLRGAKNHILTFNNTTDKRMALDF